MSFSQPNQSTTPVSNDPRLQPTPDYGSLGPGSDLARMYRAPSQPAQGPRSVRPSALLQLMVMLAGAAIAIGISASGGSSALWTRMAAVFSPHSNLATTAAPHDLDRMKPQAQAETLLEQAVNRSTEANEQIAQRVPRWRGRLQWDSQLSALTTAALNSSDMNVRSSGVEVQLAAYGVAKSDASVDHLIAQAESGDHATKVWALWTLGLIGNRGVESGRVTETLVLHLKDSDEDSRRWAVEGLALAGGDETIAPLLRAMHDDASPMVRERAACSLAESGMLTREQRMTAVPTLISYSEDASLDAQTRGWAFHALRDITGENLPDDATAWRERFGRAR